MEDAAGLDRAHMPGVHISEWETGGVTMTEVRVESEEGARLIGKPMGVYITMECPRVKKRDVDARRAVSALLGEELGRLLPPGEGDVLVIGLGNRTVTPDALGPLAVDHTLVTRHLVEQLPAEEQYREPDDKTEQGGGKYIGGEVNKQVQPGKRDQHGGRNRKEAEAPVGAGQNRGGDDRGQCVPRRK